MREIATYNEQILVEGCEYSVGTNDGKEFSKVAFEGYKKLYGKPMMVFRTTANKQVTINPSYMSFALEEETEMNPVTYRQMMDEAITEKE